MARRSKSIIFSAKTRTQRPTLVVQQLALNRLFPTGYALIRHSELVWQGQLAPTPMSRTYHVELRYKMNLFPTVKVVSPKLETRAGERLPHLYRNGDLCLFYPRAKEWHSGLLLARTIVPWASEWLFHYEIWLSTGRWCGGGYHQEHKPKP